MIILSISSIKTAKADGERCSLAIPTKCELDLATCRDDCKKVVDAAKTDIESLKQLNSDKDQTITDLHVSLDTITKDRDSDRASLGAFYHNPFILIPISLILGGVGAIYLEHK